MFSGPLPPEKQWSMLLIQGFVSSRFWVLYRLPKAFIFVFAIKKLVDQSL
jgi:hypothetical protein